MTLQIIQDGSRSLWAEGPIALPRRPGLKSVTAADLLAPNVRNVIYGFDAERVGHVDDAEQVDEEQAWLQAELDKRSKWLIRIRDLAQRQGLRLAAILGSRERAGLAGLPVKAVAIEHTPTYHVDPQAHLKACEEAGIELPSQLRHELVSASLADVFGSLRRAGYQV